MTSVAEQAEDVTIVAGRTFARTGADGWVDGEGERGIYSDDLRLLRRVQAYRARTDAPVAGRVAVGADACAVQFRLDGVEPGTGVLLVVELDGTDLFTVRELLLEPEDAAAAGSSIGLDTARSQARLRLEASCQGNAVVLVHRDGVALSDQPAAADGTARTASWRWTVPADEPLPVDVVLELRASWSLDPAQPPPPTRPFEPLERERRRSNRDWLASRPTLEGAAELELVHRRTLEDLECLRIDTEDGPVLGAGVPWFLTVFGRDTLFSAWMALPVDPSLAISTLRYLARHQAVEDDPATDAEPGKILHEERRGVAAQRWHERYYGTVDATPLFVMLLAEATRWTGDRAAARELEQPARRAVAWILARIEEDELGLLGFERRARRGLDVQSWKDSFDSQRDRAGTIARGRIRPLEAQGYAVAALRAAAELSRTAWGDDAAAAEWEAAAGALEERLVDRCLVELPASQLDPDDDPRRGGYLAQGVDSAGLPLDALCSNPGHLLWAEAIADPSLRARVAEQLCHPALDSGWGIRTMSTLDAGYHPASYHCGSVWPHDTAICIAGVARYDREKAARLARQLLEAAAANEGRLPELFSGAPRDGRERPERLPSACSPQAWAAAAPLLLVRAVLGLQPDAAGDALVATTEEAPSWLAGMRWRGVHALGRRWDVSVGLDRLVRVAPAT